MAGVHFSHRTAHQAVLPHQAVVALRIQPEGIYVDGTFGRGGHSSSIINALGRDGRLFALDRDPEAEQFAKTWFGAEPRFRFIRTRFGCLEKVARVHGFIGRVQGILLDIGVSSPQLDDPYRGFSFQTDGPLDMRMDTESGPSVAQWLAGASESEISTVIRVFGEERFHRRIARVLVEARREAAIETTGRLAQIVSSCVPTREPGKHPATRTFQAMRIFINRELEELESVLAQALRVLAPGGRLVVISFHSLEDRIVKRFMRAQARGQAWPLDLPVTESSSGATLRIIGKALRPAGRESALNPRARSAIMRVAERLP